MRRIIASLHRNGERARPGRGRALLALLGMLAFFTATVFQQVAPAPAGMIELELPELGIAPTAQPDVTIPSTQVTLILLHVLQPPAQDIDYSQIFPFINGEAAASLMEVAPSARGKLVRVRLKWRPGFELVPGRNTVELKARSRRGRVYYASFVLRTVTENRNQDFHYQTVVGNDPKQQVPPELALLEPEREVTLEPGRKTQEVRIAGVATAATAIERVSVNGEPVPLKRGAQVRVRKLGLANEDNRVSFATTYRAVAGITQIVVEAVDTAGSRTRLQIPVRTRAPAAVAEFRGRKYALLVGVSSFRHHDGGLYDLKYADADARALHKFLQSPAGGRFSPDNMLLLTNEQATLARLRAALTGFATQPGPDDLLLVFLASHGSPDPLAPQNLYFLVHDTHVDRMEETALAMDEFKTLLQKHARVRRMVLLVDTCHSAGLTGSGGERARGLTNNLVSLYAEKKLYREEGNAIITSSDVSESSQESERWGGGHGVFTHFLLRGLQGEADANADRLVTVGELFRFVRQNVRMETQYRQNPRVLAGTNEGLALAAVTTGTASR